MLDPQPTLQAWRDAVDADGYDEVRIDGIIAAGDALAVLVPQLLDQLAETQAERDARVTGDENLGMLTRQQNRHDERVAALESEKAQLLDQLAKMEEETRSYLHRMNNAETMCATWKVELDKTRGDRDNAAFLKSLAEAALRRAETESVALGERCRQLETLIREACDHGTGHYAWDEENDRAAEPPWWERAEAALGDPK